MTSVDPFFSIIIPTYNSERALECCLGSILDQHFSEFEIIIVDGLSSDQTLEIAKKKNDPRIRMYSETDRGIYDAMNKGIDLARGVWLLFLGSDDRLFDGFVLKDAHDYLIKTTAEFVYGNSQLVGGSIPTEEGPIYDGEFSLGKLFLKNICHQSIFYSKNIFHKIGYYDTKYPIFADYELNLRCFATVAVQYYDRTISLFNCDGISSRTQDNFTLEEKGFKIKEYFGYGFFNRHFKMSEHVFLSEAIILYMRKKSLEAFRYFAPYFYHTEDKAWALKKLVVTLLSKIYADPRRS
jgi:glycosyltransferase involved in cell wall biosynthesis